MVEGLERGLGWGCTYRSWDRMEDLVALGQDGMGIDRGEGSAVDESVEVRLAVVDVDGSISRRGG